MWIANGDVRTDEEGQVFVHELNQFVTVQLLEASLAKTTDTLTSGSAVKSHDRPSMAKVLSARQTISCLLSFQDYLSILKVVFYNATTGIVGTRCTLSLWKQGCIKLIFSRSDEVTSAEISE